MTTRLAVYRLTPQLLNTTLAGDYRGAPGDMRDGNRNEAAILRIGAPRSRGPEMPTASGNVCASKRASAKGADNDDRT